MNYAGRRLLYSVIAIDFLRNYTLRFTLRELAHSFRTQASHPFRKNKKDRIFAIFLACDSGRITHTLCPALYPS